MNLHTLKYTFLSFCALSLVVACSDDDNGTDIVQASCSDGIMNGTETAVDCGGASCQPCENGGDPDPMEPVALDFTGTYSQVDFMGRPGINTVLNGDDESKDAHNVSIPSEGVANFQAGFEARLVGLHDAYGAVYENNILGLDAATLTTVLAADVLEVSPNLPTTYFNPGEDNDGDDNPLTLDGDEIAFTGRALGDDVIDVSLILLFGGENGIRFSGQDTNADGEADLPRLTSDGVAITATPTDTFPYLGAPE
ncbi:hypothetical protein LCGC14_1206180 [marine sediment metagenome]